MANRIKRFTTIFFWCVRQDLNLHGRAHMILSHARIPIPPLTRVNRLRNYLLLWGKGKYFVKEKRALPLRKAPYRGQTLEVELVAVDTERIDAVGLSDRVAEGTKLLALAALAIGSFPVFSENEEIQHFLKHFHLPPFLTG